MSERSWSDILSEVPEGRDIDYVELYIVDSM